MLTVVQCTGLPVVATRTVTLDLHRKFFKQQTARGDFIFVHESMGELVEIAIMPVDGLPLLRWSQVTPTNQPLLDKEYPGWEPMHPSTAPDWRRLDEENWPKEVDQLFLKLLSWYITNGTRTQTYEQGVNAAHAAEEQLAEEELARRQAITPPPPPPAPPTRSNGKHPATVPEELHRDTN